MTHPEQLQQEAAAMDERAARILNVAERIKRRREERERRRLAAIPCQDYHEHGGPL